MATPLPEPECRLIQRAAAGDASAFQLLAEQQAETLWRFAGTLCHDRQLAEELAQETLVEAWRSLGRFDGRCRFSTWLYGILRHRFLRAMKRQSTAPEVLPADWTAPSAHGPEAQLQHTEDAARIRTAVAELPSEHRQVIELRFFAEASLEEIAAALEIPLGTVKSRLHHGLEKLRQRKLDVNLFPSTGESPARLS